MSFTRPDEQSFRAHGLVLKRTLEDNYLSAKASSHVCSEPETPPRTPRKQSRQATLQYFEDLFNKIVFNEDEFSVNSGGQLFSTPGPEKSCDITVTYWDPNGRKWITCFAECLGADETTHVKLVDLEERVAGYCTDFLAAKPDALYIHACTLVGAKIRLWVMKRNTKVLQPLWGIPEQGDLSSYQDTGSDADSERLICAFREMAGHEVIFPGGNGSVF